MFGRRNKTSGEYTLCVLHRSAGIRPRIAALPPCQDCFPVMYENAIFPFLARAKRISFSPAKRGVLLLWSRRTGPRGSTRLGRRRPLGGRTTFGLAFVPVLALLLVLAFSFPLVPAGSSLAATRRTRLAGRVSFLFFLFLCRLLGGRGFIPNVLVLLISRLLGVGLWLSMYPPIRADGLTAIVREPVADLPLIGRRRRPPADLAPPLGTPCGAFPNEAAAASAAEAPPPINDFVTETLFSRSRRILTSFSRRPMRNA